MALNFIKTGAASAQLAVQHEAEVEKRKQETGKMFRFRLQDNESGKITFVDGLLNEHNFLIPPRFYEHTLFVNGKWENFVCPAKTTPEYGGACCLCESGDFAALVSLFTIIDHRTYVPKSDPTKSYVNTRKLLVAKSQTYEVLAKIAQHLGGLSGVTFDVSRTGEKAAAVGSVFMPIGKTDIAVLQQKFMQETTDPKTNQKSVSTYFLPADYEQEIVYRSNEELIKLGLGKPTPAMGGVMSPAGPMAGIPQTPGFVPGSPISALPDYSANL